MLHNVFLTETNSKSLIFINFLELRFQIMFVISIPFWWSVLDIQKNGLRGKGKSYRMGNANDQ